MKEINIRRSVREYQDKDIEEEKLLKILASAMQAPSACNQQPWEFIVVRTREKLDELSKISRYSKCLLSAKAAIVVLGNKQRMKKEEYWQQDLGAATQNILLEATYLKIGSVWLGAYGNDERVEFLRTILNLPEFIYPYSVIALGYPKDENVFKEVNRFDQERIHYEKY